MGTIPGTGVAEANPDSKASAAFGERECAWGEDGPTLFITADKYLCRVRTKGRRHESVKIVRLVKLRRRSVAQQLKLEPHPASPRAVPQSTSAGSTLTTEETVRTGVPIACALDKNQFAERKALLDRLAQGATERKSIPNGFVFRFGPERGLVSQLASFIELERACGPFLSFRIDVKAGAIVWLELTGPVAAQEIIR